MFVKILFLVLFFGITLTVGLVCRKHARNVNDFVLGGRNVGPWLTAFAFGTSYFSAVIFVGYAGQFGWNFGIASTWIGIGNALIGSLLAWVILGRRTRVMTQHLGSATMPDFFGKRFGDPKLKIAASALVFVFLIPYTASLFNGLSRLFEVAFDVPYTLCVCVMALLTGLYVIAGGYMATAINDFIQGIIMLAGIVAVIAAVIMSNGGLTEAFASLSKIDVGSSMDGALVSFFGPQPLSLLFVVLLTSLGTWGLPQMVGKFYSIKNEKAIHTGTVVSTVFALIVAGGCYFLGGFGRLYADKIEYGANGLPVYDSIIPSMLSTLPDVLIGIVIVLVLSASMSTLSSLVLTSSSTLTLDLICSVRKKETSNKAKLSLIRIFVVFFIAVSSVIAIVQASSSVTFIAQLMGISWGALAGAFLAPFLYGLYSKRVSRASVWLSFAVSTVLMLANMFFRSTFPAFMQSPINCGVIAMLIGLVLVPLVSLFTKKQKREELDAMFSCYDETITVPIKNSLNTK